MYARALFIAWCLTLPASSAAQHPPGHQHPPPKPAEPREKTPPPKPAKPAPKAAPQKPAEPSQTAEPPKWEFMQDGLLVGMFNHQGGPRGDTEFRAQNWWMGMLHRDLRKGTLTLTGMFSLDPATVGKAGYAELFQVGESLRGEPLVDRQHPHDLIMQLGAAWRVPLNARTGLTISGAPIGEPALGPVAFMHRPSAAENPASPLGHHTLDSTHISMGVINAAVDRGPVAIEASLFNAREPDDDRWDVIDPGPLDSWSARLWVYPAPEWAIQISHGFLKEPEELEPGNVRRTTASASWFRDQGPRQRAVTVAFGRNDTSHGDFQAWLGEINERRGDNVFYARLETLNVEIGSLLHAAGGEHDDDEGRNRVTALTLGAVRDVLRPRGFEIGLGADVTLYGVPEPLERTHGSRPVSFHVFLRVRPPASPMGRMWNMIMTQPTRHMRHDAAHAHH